MGKRKGRRGLRRHRSIPTTYNGVKHRSKREARWACFFHHLNITALYEPEQFAIVVGKGKKSKRYTPDFYLPELELWIEVKPIMPLVREQKKAVGLAESGKNILILFQTVRSPFKQEEHLTLNWLYREKRPKKAYKGVWWMFNPITQSVTIRPSKDHLNQWDATHPTLLYTYRKARELIPPS